jgi:hypothetical protein
LRGRVQWREPFGQLRAEDGERGEATNRGKVTGSGIIANEEVGSLDELEQGGHCLGRGDIPLASLLPPGSLRRVASDPDLPAPGAQAADEFLVAI